VKGKPPEEAVLAKLGRSDDDVKRHGTGVQRIPVGYQQNTNRLPTGFQYDTNRIPVEYQ